MDIYSNSKTPKHKKPNKKNKKNIFVKIKEWFLNMSVKKRAIIISLLAILLVLILLISIILGYIVKWMVIYNHDEEFQIEVEPISEDVVNIALFGLDTRTKNSFKGNSDSIMILSLDKKTGSIKIISVMRDSLVKIPGYDKPRKVNSAYSYGGPELAVKTLNANFGLDISEYATVNFYGMADIIDAVGGIEVNVLQSEINAEKGINANIKHQSKLEGVTPKYIQKPGLQKLNGIQAVAWARIRSVAAEGGEKNDFGRTDRQRHVMEQLFNKALSMNATEYPKLIDNLLPYMKTSLSVSEILDLSSIITKGVKFEESRIPHDEYIINANYNVSGAGSTVYYNLEYASKVLLAYLYDGISPKDYFEKNGVDKTSWYGTGVSNKPSSTTSQSGTSSVDSTTSETTSEIGGTEDTSSDIVSSVDQTSSDETSSEQVGTDTPSEETGSEEAPTESEEGNASDSFEGTEEPTESQDTSLEEAA